MIWLRKSKSFVARNSTAADRQPLCPLFDDRLSPESGSPETSLTYYQSAVDALGQVHPQPCLSNITSQYLTKNIPSTPENDTSICQSSNIPDSSTLHGPWSTTGSPVPMGLANLSQSSSGAVQAHKKRGRQSQLSSNIPSSWSISIPPSINHIPVMLVSYYFQDVCSVFSSFDSELNPFRSYVSQVFQYSSPVFNAMLSSSAARLADEMPHLKIVGLQYQSQAMRSIAESLKEANKIPEDTLFAIFILGLSTAWHDGKDIGLAHFRAAQQAILSNSISFRGNGQSMISFFKYALVYWEMAVTLVSDEVEISDSDIVNDIGESNSTAISISEPGNVRVVPHPWTGVSWPVQVLFSRVAKVVGSLRSIKSSTNLGMIRYLKLSEEAERLEVSLWSIELPLIANVDDTGDPNTPTSHHLLLAEAYIFGALYQIYRKFPNVLRKRRDYLSTGTFRGTSPMDNPLQEWYHSLPCDASDTTLLKSLGINIIYRLQQIPISSGTRSVQAILMFVAAGSLSLPSHLISEDPCLLNTHSVQPEALFGSDQSIHIIQLREFTISRLSALRKLIHSRPVDLMLRVIKEIYWRLDEGEDVFWIDVMHEMKCETMLG